MTQQNRAGWGEPLPPGVIRIRIARLPRLRASQLEEPAPSVGPVTPQERLANIRRGLSELSAHLDAMAQRLAELALALQRLAAQLRKLEAQLRLIMQSATKLTERAEQLNRMAHRTRRPTEVPAPGRGEALLPGEDDAALKPDR